VDGRLSLGAPCGDGELPQLTTLACAAPVQLATVAPGACRKRMTGSAEGQAFPLVAVSAEERQQVASSTEANFSLRSVTSFPWRGFSQLQVIDLDFYGLVGSKR